MNLIFSYSVNEDNHYSKQGHRFLGAGVNQKGEEVHVFEEVPLLLKDLSKKIRGLTAENRFQSKECYTLVTIIENMITEVLEER
jgi:hypothetical protein